MFKPRGGRKLVRVVVGGWEGPRGGRGCRLADTGSQFKFRVTVVSNDLLRVSGQLKERILIVPNTE